MNGDQGTAIKVHTFEHFALIRPTRCAVCQAFIVRTCHTSPRVLFSVPYSRIAILGGAPRRPGPYLLPLRALRSSSSPFTSSASIPTSHAACATLRLRTLWWHTYRTTARFFDPTHRQKPPGNTRPHQVVLCLPLATASIRSRIPRLRFLHLPTHSFPCSPRFTHAALFPQSGPFSSAVRCKRCRLVVHPNCGGPCNLVHPCTAGTASTSDYLRRVDSGVRFRHHPPHLEPLYAAAPTTLHLVVSNSPPATASICVQSSAGNSGHVFPFHPLAMAPI